MSMSSPTTMDPMDVQTLKRDLARPEVHEAIVGSYDGWYSLGLGLNPKNREVRVVLQLSDPRADVRDFKREIRLGNSWLPVVVRNRLRGPHPLVLG